MPSSLLVLQLKCSSGAADYAQSVGISLTGTTPQGIAAASGGNGGPALIKWNLLGTDTSLRQGKLESTDADGWDTYSIPIGNIAASQAESQLDFLDVVDGVEIHVTADSETVKYLRPSALGSFDLVKAEAIVGHVKVPVTSAFTVQVRGNMYRRTHSLNRKLMIVVCCGTMATDVELHAEYELFLDRNTLLLPGHPRTLRTER
jgi:hypothetical protein